MLLQPPLCQDPQGGSETVFGLACEGTGGDLSDTVVALVPSLEPWKRVSFPSELTRVNPRAPSSPRWSDGDGSAVRPTPGVAEACASALAVLGGQVEVSRMVGGLLYGLLSGMAWLSQIFLREVDYLFSPGVWHSSRGDGWFSGWPPSWGTEVPSARRGPGCSSWSTKGAIGGGAHLFSGGLHCPLLLAKGILLVQVPWCTAPEAPQVPYCMADPD